MKNFSEMFAEAITARPENLRRASSYDPTGWGRCVCPLFATNNYTAQGWGTGFFIKNFPFGITAEHLLDIEALELPSVSVGEENMLDLADLNHDLSTIIPSRSIIFGTIHIPQEYSQPVQQFIFDLTQKDDPSAALRGKSRFARSSDTLFLRFPSNAPLPPAKWLPRISVKIPAEGEWVCAVGFPDIKTHSERQSQLHIRNEGMAISFARVTQVDLEGRGRYEKSPIAFVESDWPGGMSGGPVFNNSGRVVGVVSREAPATDSSPPRGSFTLLAPVINRMKSMQ